MTFANSDFPGSVPPDASADSRRTGHRCGPAALLRNRRTGTNRKKPPGPRADSVISPSSQLLRERCDEDERIEAIHAELVEIHAPATLEETLLVERLTSAAAELVDAQTAWHNRIQWQQANAGVLFDRFEYQRFETDLKAWRAAPRAMHLAFGKSRHSAEFLAELWQSVLQGLDSDLGLNFEQARHMILATGGHWHVDRLDTDHGHIMCWFLALQPNAEKFLRQWVCASRARRIGLASPEIDHQRAETFLAAAPSAEIARQNLRNLAEIQHKIWAAEAETQRQAYAADRALCMRTAPVQALGDAAEVRETRRLHRDLIRAEMRFDRIERRLLALRRASRLAVLQPTRNSARVTSATPCLQAPERTAPEVRHETPPRPELPKVATHSGPGRLRTCTVNNFAEAHADAESPACAPSFRTGDSSPGAMATKNNGRSKSSVRSETPPDDRPARRPDPKKLARAWRAQQPTGRTT